ncbi:MAG TPA: sugar-binding domain-containing protein [Candidatus Limnocylindrales bacterium]
MVDAAEGHGAAGAADDSAAVSERTQAEAFSQRGMMRLVSELYYVRELGQPEIAALTGFSVSKVSRLLAAARSAGVVRISVEGAPSEPTPLAKALSAALGVEVWVTPGHETTPAMAARLCGVAAAPRLAGELPDEGAIGLTGGYTVESLVAALPGGSHPGAMVVPLVGGWDSSNPHLNSNEIARRMAERIGAGVRLLHAPGLLDNEVTTAALLSDSAVTATTRYWGELRLALVGMSGAPRFAPGYGTVMDRLDPEGRARLAEKGAVGDVAGHLVRIDGSFVQDEWERRTISIPIESLRKVPRVVGIAAGSNKVETIVAGARTGLLHVLITDEPTAAAALRILGAGADGGSSARAGRTSEADSSTAADRPNGSGPGTAV